MTVMITRRRAITVLAAAAGLPLLLKAGNAAAYPRMVRWEGTTLGAPSTIQLYHEDEAKANAAINAGLAELARLESIFSVYRADSAISALNRDGVLTSAPPEFMELLTHAMGLAQLSEGIYDPTVQPLWQLYFRHFTAAVVDPSGPSQRDLAEAMALVGWRGVDIDVERSKVAFTRPGMGLTLNSGAQGYITDRVAEVLRSYGFEKMLVDMGEPRAISTKPDGSAWRIGLANPADPSRAIYELDVVDKCVSTSGGYGTIFDEFGKFTHIINPLTGKTAPRLLGVSVVADTATRADGLSTTMLLASVERRHAILSGAGGLKAVYVTPEGVAATVEA
ncbi:MAG: FAD:protein FMN transferase [Alphaproteobacteria bacterium]|nr:FAD:protein FMN transferase [Alphaproteobacteria bacterium]